jgi:hypothetical protein
MTGEAGTAMASETLTATKNAAWELLDVFFEYIVPIVMVIVGFMLAPTIGLSGALGTLIDSVAGTALSEGTEILIADILAAAIWGCIAGAIWGFAGSHKSRPAKYISRALGGLFAGFAVGEISAAASGKVLNGSIGTLATKTQGVLTTG